MSSGLNLNNISKYYVKNKVLENISLEVYKGEFVVLVGPSGSGKTTILRIIAGLEEPSSGEIKINNKVINSLPPKDRNIAMVFQNYALYPHMNVYDNLSFPLKMSKTKKDEIDKCVNQTSELLGIRHYLNKKPKELSGGEKQRVALGRAIIRNPELFLMDEPLSNLDAKLRVQMRSELLKLHKSLQATIVYVTHDQIEALTLGNRIVVLHEGSIQQIGTPYEVYTNPANIFVAGFIGTPAMNFFEIRVSGTGKVDFFGKEVTITLGKALLNKEIILGIRPDHLQTVNAIDDKSYNEKLILEGTVDLVEMLGSEHLIHANLVNNTHTVFSVKISGSCNFKRNDRVKVLIDLKKSYFFDKSTGKRINT